MAPQPESSHIEELIRTALTLGATEAGSIPAREIPVRDKLARYCIEPGCPGYGKSMSCPPNVAGPEKFRQMTGEYETALVVKIDLPMEILLSDQRLDLMVLLHQTVAGVERAAREMGYSRSRGFAGGSCKMLFCADKPDCRVLAGRGGCRNPDSARPSMSGFGVDVAGMMKAAGMSYNRALTEEEQKKNPLGTLAGLVLVG